MRPLLLNHIPRPWLIRLSRPFQKLAARWYRGTRYTDPIDGKTYRRFLSYGYHGRIRPNALSPGTLSLERHRLLWLYLQEETSFFQAPLRVLHFAPEQCFHLHFKKLKNLQLYTTTDLCSPIVTVKADICHLPFEDDSYDVILCNHVLEHIADDHKAMQELYRVMAPGGFGIFQVPIDPIREKTYEDFSITDPKARAEHFGQYDHVRVYGADYPDRLHAVGFAVSFPDYTAQFSDEQVERYGLQKGEKLPIVRK